MKIIKEFKSQKQKTQILESSIKIQIKMIGIRIFIYGHLLS